MLLYKIQNYLENAKCVTPPNLLGDGISSISGQRPSLESLCSVELKTALYEGQTREQILRKPCLHYVDYWLRT